MRLLIIFIPCLLLLFLASGCSNKDAARFGSAVGRTIGKPIGSIVTALDETFRTTGDVIKENPRFEKRDEPIPSPMSGPGETTDNGNSQTAILADSKTTAHIESFGANLTEGAPEFWQ